MVVILNNIRSIQNVASIFRTADAAGIQKIYLCGLTPGPIDRFGRVVGNFAKVSLGSEHFVAWEHVVRVVPLIRRLKLAGKKIYAVEQAKNAVLYSTFKVSPEIRSHIVIIMGEEVRGLPETVLRISDTILEIPMYGKKESLNVAVAFGIIVYHLRVGCALS